MGWAFPLEAGCALFTSSGAGRLLVRCVALVGVHRGFQRRSGRFSGFWFLGPGFWFVVSGILLSSLKLGGRYRGRGS